jgi:hypothetical protein
LAVRHQSLRLGVAPSPYTPLSGQHRAGFAWHDSLPGWRSLRSRDLAPRVPPSLHPGLLPGTVMRGTGILTRCPSPTALALGLGPPHPQLISMAAEPSGIRWGGFAPPSRYSCRHSHSPPLHVGSHLRFSADGDAPLPWQSVSTIRGFGHGLEPRWIVGAAAQSTSELLRTLSRMAASKPTSWLSTRRDHLAH